MKRFRFFSIPYLVWMILLVVIPLVAMFILSFLDMDGLSFSGAKFTMGNFAILRDTMYIKAYWNSFRIAIISTVICFLIGYPVAYFVAKSNIRNKMGVMMVLLLPMWSNIILRIYAWEKLFIPNSILNSIGISLDLLGSEAAIIIGTVTTYLPFMILPIFTVLEKMNRSLVEASMDLGANRVRTFFKVVFPMSGKGVFSGCVMVFLPAATGFAVPYRLGAGSINMIGTIIEDKFKMDYDYNLGSLLSIVLVVVVMGVMLIMSKVDESGETII